MRQCLSRNHGEATTGRGLPLRPAALESNPSRRDIQQEDIEADEAVRVELAVTSQVQEATSLPPQFRPLRPSLPSNSPLDRKFPLPLQRRAATLAEDEVDGDEATELVSTRQARPPAPKQPQVRLPKSVAEDLPTRIHEDIANWNYECAICTDDVVRTSHIWSCVLCWTVVHLKCARKWHDNQKKHDDCQPAEPRSESSWRCPACNSKLLDDPGSYHCWCGKEISPSPASAALPPHSCGQTCSKPRPTCPHPCPLQCHAGPCPPCGLMGPAQSCFCGKNSSRKLCRETDYENGWSCQEPCQDVLPCSEHLCRKPCHPGLCGDCDAPVEARDEPRQSYGTVQEAWFEGSFECRQPCKRSFDCGLHECSRCCHVQDEKQPHCPRAPDVVSHCPCGKTTLEQLLEQPRKSCEDPIPRCREACEKVQACGHRCQAKCHTGECGFCRETMDISCRCGRTSSRSLCHQGDIQHPLCMRSCQATLSCGRHKCGERCCPGEKAAVERQRKKNRPAGDVHSMEPEHICIRTCGRPLKCGSHECQQMCHRGPCSSCLEAIFHEISCDCGRTVLQPPQPCGTQPPECRFNCQRRPECGHPPVEHSCHGGDVPCPKCPFLVTKSCACGKERLQSQPCHLQEAHCGKRCGNKLKCGLHVCQKLCHRPGDCEDIGLPPKRCLQLCGKTKLFCDHPCQNPCHGQTPCDESTACTSKATVSCPCGVRQQEVRCLASSSNATPSRPDIKCDDECLRLERNRRLATALNIDPSSHTNDHVPYSDTTLRLFRENVSWSESQEREFRVFARSANEVRLRYKPMSSPYRQFLHVLAQDYGLESRSEDVEPHRYVVVFKGPRFVSAPSKTLAHCIRIRDAQSAAAKPQPPPPTPIEEHEPFNAFLLTSPRFAITLQEVTSALAEVLASQPSLHFTTTFLPTTEEILLRATAPYSALLSPQALQQTLTTLKPSLSKSVQKQGLAATVLLCHAQDSNLVSRRQQHHPSSAPEAGWSAVAGRAAAGSESAPSAAQSDRPESARGPGRKLLGLRKKKGAATQGDGKLWDALEGDVEC
ncbi:hypothetical protein CDD80_4504 [Ophiocordyceps camponoti-rufipedis]|uniref:R3H domain-containing protein n=1 Tax=Ophiocordyceps camponoti-rufipedis TaxID=2004952 RepID=A0A2C5YY91_9HYPO|nr:hypothetical protein CDD80_4504 [Ophiocordyceps camponoti-rufipedis]